MFVRVGACIWKKLKKIYYPYGLRTLESLIPGEILLNRETLGMAVGSSDQQLIWKKTRLNDAIKTFDRKNLQSHKHKHATLLI